MDVALAVLLSVLLVACSALAMWAPRRVTASVDGFRWLRYSGTRKPRPRVAWTVTAPAVTPTDRMMDPNGWKRERHWEAADTTPAGSNLAEGTSRDGVRWPDLAPNDSGVEHRHQRYYVDFAGSDGRRYWMAAPERTWRDLAIGTEYELRVTWLDAAVRARRVDGSGPPLSYYLHGLDELRDWYLGSLARRCERQRRAHPDGLPPTGV